MRTKGLPAKNLALIPQRIAIACQEAGWIVRSQIIIPSWMPESAKDRPTDSYRTVLMLCKTGKYWYDHLAVQQPCAQSTQDDPRYLSGRHTQLEYPVGAPSWYRGKYFPEGDGLRSLGDIWTHIPPAAYPDAHFATFAVEEPETCIKASCPEAICVKCGKPRVRIVKTELRQYHPRGSSGWNLQEANPHKGQFEHSPPGWRQEPISESWSDCGCGAGWTPGLTLDPFIGTGTTAVAARKLGRRCIGIDASEDYLKQAVTRLTVGDTGIRRMVQARRAGAEQGRFDA
jgi:hypothetical protein